METALIAIAVVLLSTAQPPNAKPHEDTGHDKEQAATYVPDAVAPSQPKTNTEIYNDYRCCKEANSTQPAESMQNINTIATVVMAVFTVALCCLVYFQLRAYQTRERAWMIMSIKEKGPVLQTDKQTAQLRWDYKNFGETPAMILWDSHCAKILDPGESLPIEPPYLSEVIREIKNDAIAPGGGTPIFSKMGEVAFNEVESGRKILWLYGHIVYRDIFRKKRETRYCFRYYPEADPNGMDGNVGFFSAGPPGYNQII